MSQADQGNNIPMKRRPGRPPQNPQPSNQSLNSRQNVAAIGIPPVPPGFEGRTRYQPDQPLPINSTTDASRVGSLVCGVIDAEFDGGYLLSARAVDNPQITLRGVVYKPGRYVAAPDVPSMGRNENPDVPPGSSTSIPSASPPPDGPTPSNQMPTVQTEGREDEIATINQPSNEALLEVESASLRLPDIPFEKLMTEVVKRIHA